jgi:glycosyltransferase involved in cell wall biosynthesis
MRILMVSNLWPPEVVGGAEQYAAALAGHLRAAGHEVQAFTFGVTGPDVVHAVAPRPYAIQTAPSQPAYRRARFHATDVYNPRTRRDLGRVLEEFRPDVVHSHAVQGLSSAALTAARRAGVGQVHTLHDYWLLCQRNSLVRRSGEACETRCRSCVAMAWARNEVVRRAPPEVVIGVSRAIAAEHERIPWVAERLRVVHNPVEVVTGTRTVAPGDGRPLTFGFLGRLSTEKGLGTLLAAFGGAGLGDARLVVAGRGPLDARVRAAGGKVIAAGWVPPERKEALLADLDCLVVPSEWQDPAPVVVNEARGRGIPVIGARRGGIPELVAPVNEPLLFPPGDAAALADRLRAFAADPAAFRPEPEAEPLGWERHLDLVLAAYADARAAGRGTA